MTKKPIQPQDKYVLRMPDGLRERIKAYAERNGRSMNSEIVRVLEREFPEPWTIETRIADLLGLIAIMKEAEADERVSTLIEALRETAHGIVTGRMKGVDEDTRRRIQERLEGWELEQAEDAHLRLTEAMDQEELSSYERGHGTSKV